MNTFNGANTIVLLAALFLLVAVMTNILSNNATALIFTPIAINTAQQLNVDPTPFVHVVIFAANCSFITPIGYQTNLFIFGPGGYKFLDYARVGVGLNLIIIILVGLFLPLIWPLY